MSRDRCGRGYYEGTTKIAAAAAIVAELEAKHREAQQETVQAREYAAALTGRLATGDQAKATAIGQELATAREALWQACATDLIARLRAGDPFLSADQIDKELDRIAA